MSDAARLPGRRCGRLARTHSVTRRLQYAASRRGGALFDRETKLARRRLTDVRSVMAFCRPQADSAAAAPCHRRRVAQSAAARGLNAYAPERRWCSCRTRMQGTRTFAALRRAAWSRVRSLLRSGSSRRGCAAAALRSHRRLAATGASSRLRLHEQFCSAGPCCQQSRAVPVHRWRAMFALLSSTHAHGDGALRGIKSRSEWRRRGTALSISTTIYRRSAAVLLCSTPTADAWLSQRARHGGRGAHAAPAGSGAWSTPAAGQQTASSPERRKRPLQGVFLLLRVGNAGCVVAAARRGRIGSRGAAARRFWVLGTAGFGSSQRCGHATLLRALARRGAD